MWFLILIILLFAFVINPCYNKGTKAKMLLPDMVHAKEKPGVAAPGFLIGLTVILQVSVEPLANIISSYTCHNRY